jgi:hypothetical protein
MKGDEMTDQQTIQTARQYEPDNDALVEAGSAAETEASLPLARAVIRKRLEYLRAQINGECISYGEIAELQDLAEHIEPDDVQLLEWAAVPEFPARGARYRAIGARRKAHNQRLQDGGQ